jgi:hypothetical protein
MKTSSKKRNQHTTVLARALSCAQIDANLTVGARETIRTVALDVRRRQLDTGAAIETGLRTTLGHIEAAVDAGPARPAQTHGRAVILEQTGAAVEARGQRAQADHRLAQGARVAGLAVAAELGRIRGRDEVTHALVLARIAVARVLPELA